jgi:signal transduction histidine kinase
MSPESPLPIGGPSKAVDQDDSSILLELMAEMRFAQEAERMRVATFLHDEVGQSLAAFKMKCFALEGRWRATEPRFADELIDALRILDDAIASVREVSEDLRPGALRLGLEAAIEWQAERFQAQSEIACVVDIGADQSSLDPHRATELFRIFQDALENIRLHSGTTTIDVSLTHAGGNLVLEIRDNGIPPDPQSSEYVLGVFTMKERARRAGGRVQVADSKIEVMLKLDWAAAN